MLVHNAHIVNEGRIFKGSVLVEDGKIAAIFKTEPPKDLLEKHEVIDATDCWLLPGVIDPHVHFRDPGKGDSGDFASESAAAIAGGVTSVLDMPNTQPPVTSVKVWEEKMQIAASKCLCNYSCYIAATDSNLDELLGFENPNLCGIKLFMGSTTGSMAMADPAALERLFKEAKLPIVVHAESDAVIARNRAHFSELYGEEIPVECHSSIRSDEACFAASSQAVNLAMKYSTRLHVAHLSTQKELALFKNAPLDAAKRITCEVCPHYLVFAQDDYERLGSRIKCNPAIKSEADRRSLLSALGSDRIDIVATDHAPHTLQAKQGTALTAASGMPGVQFSLPIMLDFAKQGALSIEKVVEKMCHNPAKLFGIQKRGFIRKGFAADLVVVARNKHWTLTQDKILSRCGWSPYENRTFTTQVLYTIVNGKLAYQNGSVVSAQNGQAMVFGE